MKPKFKSLFVLGGALFALPFASSAQHGHLNVGATGRNQGDQLIWANGADFIASSGYVKPLVAATDGRFAGYFEGGITFTALPLTSDNGGPDPQAPAAGSFEEFAIVKAAGPIGGQFGFWESGSTAPTHSLLSGDTSEQLFPLSEGDGSAGSDPFGHIHGRRFTTTKAGVYTAWFKAFDTSVNGANGGPIHTPSEALPIRFLAGEPALLDQVPMGGGMVHVNIQYADHGAGPHLHVHLDTGTPALTPLAVSQPDQQFAPAMPWFEQLDPSLQGQAFNRQYGFLLDPTSEPLPTGHKIWIRQLSASPELKVYTYRQTPPAWDPMFGTDGSADLFQWSMTMFHPAYAAPATAAGPFTATYEALVVDDLDQPTGVTEEFTLTWNVTPGLQMAAPTVEPGMIHVPVTVPATWNGYSYRLERTGDFKSWTVVDEHTPAGPGNIDLHDDAPSPDHGIYRVRPTTP